MSDPIREAQARAAEFNAQARTGVVQHVQDPARVALEELVAAIEGYLASTPMRLAGITRARLTLALNAARNALKAPT